MPTHPDKRFLPPYGWALQTYSLFSRAAETERPAIVRQLNDLRGYGQTASVRARTKELTAVVAAIDALAR